MKKSLIILATIAFALVSCNNEILDNTADVNHSSQTNIVFNLTVNHPDGAATKAVKTGWENGDAIYVFFNNVAAPKYLKMSYNGTAWSYTEMDGSSVGSLGLTDGATGTMRAIYLPFGNALTVGNDGTSFTFSETTYSYYLTATLDYTVSSGKVSGAFDMAIPDGYVQFFLDDANASSTTDIELREPHLTPQGIASITANGSITHTNVAHGAPLKGYVYDKNSLGTDKGYLFSGILETEARNKSTNYDFTVVSGGWQGTYYAKAFTGKTWYRNSGTEGRALKMPALSGWTTITNYQPIDLGCDAGGKRIYWAKCNIGASTETGYGNYYAWGETSTKTSYSWSNYAWGNGEDWELTKYNFDSSYGTKDDLYTLELTDDAAYMTIGGKFRMPTKAEFDALLGLSKEWVTDYNGSGINGYKFTGNGNILFLPAAGAWRSSSSNVNSGCYYWSSSLITQNDPTNATFLLVNSYTHSIALSNNERYWGYSVRPVSE